MNKGEFKNIIKRLTYVNDISQSNWQAGIEECWEQEINILTEDINGTINYLKTECTAEEYSWIAEVLDDIIEITQSKELLQTYIDLMNKFPEECKKYNIEGCIECAKDMLEGDNE